MKGSGCQVLKLWRKGRQVSTRALAMAILCFCPPDSWAPLSPTRVSNCLRIERRWGGRVLGQPHDEVKGVGFFGSLHNFILGDLNMIENGRFSAELPPCVQL